MRILPPALALLLCIGLAAQEAPKFKFGEVSADDFRKFYEIDSAAAAVILTDVGSSEITGNSKGSFSLIFKTHYRAHILDQKGYDISNISIPLYKSGTSEERLENLRASTYNLENGKVVQTKLDVKSAVFKDVVSNNWVVRKFTFPNVKEGSIIEYEYRVVSDFIHNLQGWSFQSEHPTLWSEYRVKIPGFLTYLTLSQGLLDFVVNEKSSSSGDLHMSDGRGLGSTQHASVRTDFVHSRWAVQNAPALKEESYTSTVNNYISKMQFQLSSIGYPFEPKQFMSSWPEVARQLLEDEDFGAGLEKDNGWLGDVMKGMYSEADEPLVKAKKIFEWVRDYFTCTSHNRIYLTTTPRNVLKSKSGNEAEINILLTTMLKRAGLKADPLLLSTRGHGFVHPVYPIMERFNYVITRLEIDRKNYYLDASHPMLGFGRLNYDCYNGHAFIINPEATPTRLDAAELKEESYVSVFMVNGENGATIGSVKHTPGYYNASTIRKTIREKGKEAFDETIKKKHGTDFNVKDVKVDSLDQYDDVIYISYGLDLAAEKEEIIYLNPMFGHGYSENPFKSAKRLYPVEMPFTVDETYNLQMEVPAGYEIDELPQQAVVKFDNAGNAEFEYRLSHSGNLISLRSRLRIKKTLFHPDDYEVLREFFSIIVAKHNEQIVFKKKKG